MKARYVSFFLVTALLGCAVWSEFLRFRIRMLLFAGLLLSIIYLSINLPRWVLRYLFFAFCLVAVFCLGGLNLSATALANQIHVLPTYIFLPLVCSGILACILTKGDYKLVWLVLGFSFVVILYSSIKTIVAPVNASRVFLGNARNDEMLMIALDNLNGGVLGYAQIHGLPFVVCALIYIVKYARNVWLRIASGILGICAALAMYRSGYTAAMLCLLLVGIVSSVSVKNRKITIAGLCLMAVGFWGAVESGLLLSALETILPHMDASNSIGYKIKEFADYQTSVNGSAYWNVRSSAYAENWRLILQSPLYGHGEGVGPGHSQMLEILVGGGLMVFIPYIIYICSFFAFVAKCLPTKGRWYFVVASWIFLLLAYMKASALLVQYEVLLLMMPLALLVNKADFYAASYMACKILKLKCPNRVLYEVQYLNIKRMYGK